MKTQQQQQQQQQTVTVTSAASTVAVLNSQGQLLQASAAGQLQAETGTRVIQSIPVVQVHAPTGQMVQQQQTQQQTQLVQQHGGGSHLGTPLQSPATLHSPAAHTAQQQHFQFPAPWPLPVKSQMCLSATSCNNKPRYNNSNQLRMC